jgi:hypothetical protein
MFFHVLSQSSARNCAFGSGSLIVNSMIDTMLVSMSTMAAVYLILSSRHKTNESKESLFQSNGKRARDANEIVAEAD